MIGIRVAAPLEVRREGMSRVRDAVRVGVLQTRLLAVRAGQPAEQMVERTVLHHHDDDVVDPGPRRRRQRAARVQAGYSSRGAAGEPHRPNRCRARDEEFPA
jgi:hypothetical protein